MRACRVCETPFPEAEYKADKGNICRTCRLAQSKAEYHRRKKAAGVPPPRTTSRPQRVCDVLANGPLTRPELLARLGLSREQLNVALHTLREQRRIIVTGDPPKHNNQPDPRLYGLAHATPADPHQVQHYRKSSPGFDTEHDAWLRMVRAQKQARQQKMEC